MKKTPMKFWGTEAAVHKVHLALLFICLAVPQVSMAMKAGVVTTVRSGDMVFVKHNNGVVSKVRLYGVEAPAPAQPFSENSRRMLGAMVGGKNVIYQVRDTNKDGTVNALLYLDNLSINAAMVKAGYVWVKPECTEELRGSLDGYQNFAQDKKRGLWQQQDPVAPWDWREENKDVYAYTAKWQAVQPYAPRKRYSGRSSKRIKMAKRSLRGTSPARRGST